MIERSKTYKWYDQTLPPNISVILLSNISLKDEKVDEVIITTTQKQILLTPLPDQQLQENMSRITDYHIFRMKKFEIQRLLKEERSPFPNFAKDEDDLDHITQRFDAMQAKKKQRNSFRREIYFDYQIPYQGSIWRMKVRMRDLMQHFVYVTRYKLPYTQLLRRKYKGHLKYQIGYCFALLRHLRQEQKNLYSALKNFHKLYNNLVFHMKMYEKIVRLDVDIKDICRLIKVLNYKRNLEDDEDYYKDSEESEPESLRIRSPRKFRRATGVHTLGVTRTNSSLQRSLKPDTSKADMLYEQVMQPSSTGFPKPPLNQGPYEMQAQTTKSKSPKTPVSRRNGRWRYAAPPNVS